MKTLGAFLIVLFATLSMNGQQNIVSSSSDFAQQTEVSTLKKVTSKDNYNLDLQNYYRIRKEDREYFVPHTRKLKLELDIKRSFLKVGKKTNHKIKLA